MVGQRRPRVGIGCRNVGGGDARIAAGFEIEAVVANHYAVIAMRLPACEQPVDAVRCRFRGRVLAAQDVVRRNEAIESQVRKTGDGVMPGIARQHTHADPARMQFRDEFHSPGRGFHFAHQRLLPGIEAPPQSCRFRRGQGFKIFKDQRSLRDPEFNPDCLEVMLMYGEGAVQIEHPVRVTMHCITLC